MQYMTGLISLLTCTLSSCFVEICSRRLLFVLNFSHKRFGLDLNTDVKTQIYPNQSEPSTIVNAVYDWAYQFTNMYSCLFKNITQGGCFLQTICTQTCLLCLLPNGTFENGARKKKSQNSRNQGFSYLFCLVI